ncbi:MAG: thioredoxin family protein [Sulfurimonadaceae bacterium]|nr:thioredoxin family protein [Sulfurimonadaceae bacterium]
MRLLFALMLTAVTLLAAPLTWQKDYATAQQLAKQNNKKIFVFISTEDCNWCDKLEATTLSDPDIVSRMEKEYASVHVTRGKDLYPKELKAVVVPMCYFLDSNGNIVDYARGYWDSTDFNLILNDVNKRMKKMKEKKQ